MKVPAAALAAAVEAAAGAAAGAAVNSSSSPCQWAVFIAAEKQLLAHKSSSTREPLSNAAASSCSCCCRCFTCCKRCCTSSGVSAGRGSGKKEGRAGAARSSLQQNPHAAIAVAVVSVAAVAADKLHACSPRPAGLRSSNNTKTSKNEQTETK